MIMMPKGADFCSTSALQAVNEHEAGPDGPPYFKAPELLKHGPHSTATDVYAYGMLLYEVLYRREPFAGESSEVGAAPLPLQCHADDVLEPIELL